MAPAVERDVIQRDTSTGKTFSVVFAVTAFLVVAICILWGYFIPRWRFKYGRPSSTRFNCIGGAAQHSLGTPPRAPRYEPHFPSHPGVRAVYQKSALPIYDPRTESPFGNRPRNIEVVHLRSFTPTNTAATQPKISSTDKKPTHHYWLPKTPKRASQWGLTRSVWEQGLEEAEDCQRPIHPGPPVARPAGRAPPLTKQLALFPTPDLNSNKHFDTLAHPTLLFEKLDKSDGQTLPPFLGGSYVPRPTVGPARKRYGDGRRNTSMQKVHKAKSEKAQVSEAGAVGGSCGRQPSLQNILEFSNGQPSSIRKYKPKTPVENIRGRYDRYVEGGRFIPPRTTSLQRHLTPSTEPLTGSASARSKFAVLTTPPTSPLPINDPALIPTPLRMRHAAARAAAASPTPAPSDEKHDSLSGSSVTVPRKLTPFSLHSSPRSKREIRISTGVYHPKSTVGTTGLQWKPFRIHRSSWKGSSVYSRDTKGMSILRSPRTTPRANKRSGNPLPLGELSPRPAISMDLVRSKIDEWNLHTGDLELPISVSLDRRQSDAGPSSTSFGTETISPALMPATVREDAPTTFGLMMSMPKIFVGRPSDDVFGDEGSAQNSGRVLRRVLDMEMASTEFKPSTHYGRTAPGGAEWI